MNFKEAAFLVSIVFLISGCTTTQTGAGLIIEGFGPDLPEVFSGEEVTFSGRIRNTGSLTATNVRATLLGLNDWYGAGRPIGKGGWIGTEKLPEEEECAYTSSGASLLPPNPQFSTAGGNMVCSWKYFAPSIPEGTLAYNPTMRVFYNYRSETVKLISILPRGEMIRLQQSGRPLPGETKSISMSPVRIDIETPSIIRASGDSVEFQLRVTINNIDRGIACYPDSLESCKNTNDNWNRIKISLAMPDGITLSDCQEHMVLDLFHGTSNSVVCRAVASGISMDTPKQHTISVSGEYLYMLDMSAEITVKSSHSLR